ncbi:MAG: hypothetical protein HY961_04245 [Ignavibacteriae bacterium]|nr:hypothetical protein [Ignavibacteriota bacterium]
MADNATQSEINRLLGEIEKLDVDAQDKLYMQLKKRRRSREEALVRAMKYCGIAPHYWGEDAQDYINRMRSDDRL